jgi:hypothetical protein
MWIATQLCLRNGLGECDPKRLDFRSTSVCFSFFTTKNISFFEQDVFFTSPAVQFGVFCIQTMLSTSIVFSGSMSLKVVNHINLIWKLFHNCAAMTVQKAPFTIIGISLQLRGERWRHYSPSVNEDLKTWTNYISGYRGVICLEHHWRLQLTDPTPTPLNICDLSPSRGNNHPWLSTVL